MAQKSIYIVENTDKYIGKQNPVCRSSWERQLCKWLDANPNVRRWNSEGVVIPYICNTDGRKHRYFVDFFIEFENGKRIIVEVKPAKETMRPKPPKRKTPRWYREYDTWLKNTAKWEAANRFAKNHDMEFFIWTEHYLKKIGAM